MKLSAEACDCDRLRELSFTEVFRDFAELARRNWELREVERHILRRALRCRKKRRREKGYAAVSRTGRQADSERDTAW